MFSYLGLFFEMTQEPSSLEEGTLVEDDWDLPCTWQKGGGETSGIGREALRVVDYVDSSMWYLYEYLNHQLYHNKYSVNK